MDQSARREMRQSETEGFGKVVPKRKLDAEVVRLEAIQKVLPASPLKLTADHHVLNRIVKKVREPVVTAMIGIGRLAVGVIDVHERVAHRGAETFVPVVV